MLKQPFVEQTLITIISSLGLMLFLLSVRISHAWIRNIIYELGGLTFSVYLIHRAVYTKLNSLGVRSVIYKNADNGPFQYVFAVVLYILIVYFVSLLIAYLINRFIRIFTNNT